MAWIELHQTLRDHRKMFSCAEELGISRTEMIGTLVCLWLWALDNAEDGSLQGISPKTLANICYFPERKASKLVAALLKHGFLDGDCSSLSIHDWNDYAGRLMDRREKDRERKRVSAKQQKEIPQSSIGNQPEIRRTSAGTQQEIQRNSEGIPQEFRRNSTGTPNDFRADSCATVPIPYHNSTNGINIGDLSINPAPAQEQPVSDAFERFWAEYPKKSTRRKEDAYQTWQSLNPTPDGAAHIMAQLKAWKASSRWAEQGGRFIPNVFLFLDPEGEYLTTTPAAGKQPGPVKASCTLGREELEAIQRVLREEP